MTNGEYNFVEFFKDIIERRTMTYSEIRYCNELLGTNFSASCPSCAHSSAIELKNLYACYLEPYKEEKTRRQLEINKLRLEEEKLEIKDDRNKVVIDNKYYGSYNTEEETKEVLELLKEEDLPANDPIDNVGIEVKTPPKKIKK